MSDYFLFLVWFKVLWVENMKLKCTRYQAQRIDALFVAVGE